MIEGLLKLLKIMTELIKHRKLLYTQQFEKLVAPMYVNLQSVHENYIAIFEAAHRELNEGAIVAGIAKKLSEDRLTHEAIRRSIVAMSHSFAVDEQLDAFSDFFKAVCNYFYPLRSRTTASTTILQELGLLAEKEANNEDVSDSSKLHPRDLASCFIEAALEQIRRDWMAVSKQYALAVASISK